MQAPTRLGNFCEIPRDVVEVVKDGIRTVAGAGAVVLFIASCGRFERVNDWADEFYSIDIMVKRPFMRIATIVNPKSEFVDKDKGREIPAFSFASKIMSQRMNRANAKENESFFVRHVVVRIVEAVVGVAATIGAIADSILGLAAWVPVILTAGYYPKLNAYALQNTRFLGIAKLVETVKRVVNPYYDYTPW